MRRPDARIRRAAGVALACATTLGATGCTQIDNFFASIPFFGFMREAPFYDPYEMPRPAPPNSVPYASPRGGYVPQFPRTAAGLEALAAAVEPPASLPPGALERGAELYQRQCMVCHGVAGAGDGPIVGGGKFPFAPSLVAPPATGRSPGYVYAVIEMGRGLMPPYGERMTNEEQWYIVAYLEQLQGGGAGGAAAPGAAPASGGATSPGAAPGTGGAASPGPGAAADTASGAEE